METLRRTLAATTQVEDSRRGIATFTASDATIDSYREIIRPDAWRFDMFRKHAPVFVDHDYRCEKQIGKVVDFKVRGGKLVETIQFAIDVPSNELAHKVWEMVAAKYIKACSVGFVPENYVQPGDDDWLKQLKELGLSPNARVRRVYTQVQQMELSIVGLGANENALANSRGFSARTDRAVNAMLDVLKGKRRQKSSAAQGYCSAISKLLSTLRRS